MFAVGMLLKCWYSIFPVLKTMNGESRLHFFVNPQAFACTKDTGQGHKGQVVVVVMVWGQAKVQSTTDYSEVTHAATVSSQLQTECVVLEYNKD